MRKNTELGMELEIGWIVLMRTLLEVENPVEKARMIERLSDVSLRVVESRRSRLVPKGPCHTGAIRRAASVPVS